VKEFALMFPKNLITNGPRARVMQISKSFWVEARELKFRMNMRHQTTYSDLFFFEIRLKVFLKNSEIYLKNGQKKSKSVWVEARELKFCMIMLC
jgi:hypothetical protein